MFIIKDTAEVLRVSEAQVFTTAFRYAEITDADGKAHRAYNHYLRDNDNVPEFVVDWCLTVLVQHGRRHHDKTPVFA